MLSAMPLESTISFPYMSQGRSTRWSLGMGDLPPLMTGILISWVYFHPYGLGLMSLSVYPLLYGNVMGVDRPDRTYGRWTSLPKSWLVH